MHPLIKLAFYTHYVIYKWWIPCKIGWNNNSPIRLKLENSWGKLLPWYFVTWIMLFGISVGSIGFVLIREIFQPSPKITAIHIGILFYIGFGTSITWGVCLAFHEYWNEVVSTFNQFAMFEEDWRKGPAEAYRHPKTQYMRIWKLSYEELTGMILNMIIVGCIITMPIGVLAGILTNLDTFIILLEDYFLLPSDERSTFVNVFLILSRLTFTFVCGMELSRFMLITLILTFSVGMVMEKLLINILETEDLNEAYQKYQLVWLQHYIVKSPFNNVLAIGALIGFVGGTSTIWLSFNAWNYVSPFLAGLCPFVSVWILIILLVVISSQVSIVEKSGRFIHKWKKESLIQNGIPINKNIRHSKRLGRTLRRLPVACGPCCGINSNTPFSFLQILMKAVTDSLLGIQL
ncbi:unnamed protein product [Orchesella dallaii]|uniref:Uncharacterized protein n=1 Tax=Orchesella dallaii TaxID=48710 RepID=A0ABP1R741_9HEXA